MDIHHRIEELNPVFTKYVFDFHGTSVKPMYTTIHHFTGIAPVPHDHPFTFRSHILRGSYVERVYQYDKHFKYWRAYTVHRKEGTSHIVHANYIHEIIELPEYKSEEYPDGECITMTILGPHEREWGEWKFSEGMTQAWFKQHNEPDFILFKPQ